jgi:hypothetical protein
VAVVVAAVVAVVSFSSHCCHDPHQVITFASIVYAMVEIGIVCLVMCNHGWGCHSRGQRDGWRGGFGSQRVMNRLHNDNID